MLQKQWRFFWQIMVTMVVSMGLLSPVIAQTASVLDRLTTVETTVNHSVKSPSDTAIHQAMCDTFAQNSIQVPNCHGESIKAQAPSCEANCTMNACTVVAPTINAAASFNWPKSIQMGIPHPHDDTDFSSAILATQTPPPRHFC